MSIFQTKGPLQVTGRGGQSPAVGQALLPGGSFTTHFLTESVLFGKEGPPIPLCLNDLHGLGLAWLPCPCSLGAVGPFHMASPGKHLGSPHGEARPGR